MIDVHAHVVLEGVMGCAGHYGPELGVGESGSAAIPGRRLHPRRCRLPGFAVHGRRPPAGTQRPPRHRVADPFAEPDHLLPPHRGGRRSGFLSLAQRRAGGCRRRPSRSLPGIRPAADAGHRRRRGRAAAGCRRPRAASVRTSAPTSASRSTTIGSTRCGRRPSSSTPPYLYILLPPASTGRCATSGSGASISTSRSGFLYEETLALACLVFGGVLDRFPARRLLLARRRGGGVHDWTAGAPGSHSAVGAGATGRFRRGDAPTVVRQPRPRRRVARSPRRACRRRPAGGRHQPRRLGRPPGAGGDPVPHRVRRQRPPPAATDVIRRRWPPSHRRRR